MSFLVIKTHRQIVYSTLQHPNLRLWLLSLFLPLSDFHHIFGSTLKIYPFFFFFPFQHKNPNKTWIQFTFLTNVSSSPDTTRFHFSLKMYATNDKLMQVKLSREFFFVCIFYACFTQIKKSFITTNKWG